MSLLRKQLMLYIVYVFFFKKGRWGVGEVFAVAMAYHKVCEHECKTLGNKHKLYLTKKMFKSKTILEEEEKRRRKKS